MLLEWLVLPGPAQDSDYRFAGFMAAAPARGKRDGRVSISEAEILFQEKDTFVTRMKIRAQNGGLGADEIVEMADSGNLTQSTVELWRASGGDSAARFVDRISG